MTVTVDGVPFGPEPFAPPWRREDFAAVLDQLAREAVPGVEEVTGRPGARVYRRTLRLPYGTGIAAVAERVLLDDGHEGGVHRLTGPAAATNADQVAAIGAALGRELAFVEIDPAAAGPELFPYLDAHMLDRLLKTFEATIGVTPEITDTVERITGTPARTFARWARDHVADFGADSAA